MKDRTIKNQLLMIYNHLFDCYGPQHWWPGEESFEVIVGAILTQSAAWTNVEKGILKLKKAQVLSSQAIRKISHEELAELIHSCGYYNAKAIKLKAFANWFGNRFDDDLEKMFVNDTFSLRNGLLGVHGIGEETADSILLYAGNKPIFVIDAYTRRIFDRLGFKLKGNKYADYQKLFMDNLPHETQMFNEYHALLVALGKYQCLKSLPACKGCCLKSVCSFNCDSDALI